MICFINQLRRTFLCIYLLIYLLTYLYRRLVTASVYVLCLVPAIVTPSPSSAAQRRAQRRLTRVDNRYHSGLSFFVFLSVSLCLHTSYYRSLMYTDPCQRPSLAYYESKITSVWVTTRL